MIPDPNEEEEERREREDLKRSYIKEAMERKAAKDQGDDTPLDRMD